MTSIKLFCGPRPAKLPPRRTANIHSPKPSNPVYIFGFPVSLLGRNGSAVKSHQTRLMCSSGSGPDSTAHGKSIMMWISALAASSLAWGAPAMASLDRMSLEANRSSQAEAELMRNRIEEVILEQMSKRLHSMSNAELGDFLEKLLESPALEDGNQSSPRMGGLPPESLDFEFKKNGTDEVVGEENTFATSREESEDSFDDRVILKPRAVTTPEEDWSFSVERQLNRFPGVLNYDFAEVTLGDIASWGLAFAGSLVLLVWVYQSLTRSEGHHRDRNADDNLNSSVISDGAVHTTSSDPADYIETTEEGLFWGVWRLWPWSRKSSNVDNATTSNPHTEEALSVGALKENTANPDGVGAAPIDTLEDDTGYKESTQEVPDTVLWRREDSAVIKDSDDTGSLFLAEGNGVYRVDQSSEPQSEWKPSYWMDPWSEDASVQTEALDGAHGVDVGQNEGANEAVVDREILEGSELSNETDSSAWDKGVEGSSMSAWDKDRSNDTLYSNVDDSKPSQIAKIVVIGNRQQNSPMN